MYTLTLLLYIVKLHALISPVAQPDPLEAQPVLGGPTDGKCAQTVWKGI